MISRRRFECCTRIEIVLIILFILILSICSAQTNRHITDEKVPQRFTEVPKQKIELKAAPQIIKKLTEASPYVSLGVFKVTAYDLSTESCEKPVGSPGYGVTASGYNLTGHTWDSARVIAVDPNIIPLGTKIYVSFTIDKMKKYDGIYTARDVGGGINGYEIDFFMGDFNSNGASNEAKNFGIKQATLYVLKKT